MKRILSFILLFLAVAAFAACGGDDHGHSDDDGHHEDDDHGHKDGDHDDDHDHEHGDDDHEGHEHDDDSHGERVELGKVKLGAHSVKLALFGEIEAGHEAVLDIEVDGDECAAVRAWVGIESGKGSLKAKIDGKEGEYHGHLEVPAKLPDGSAIWIELEDGDGKKQRTSFKIPREP